MNICVFVTYKFLHMLHALLSSGFNQYKKLLI